MSHSTAKSRPRTCQCSTSSGGFWVFFFFFFLAEAGLSCIVWDLLQWCMGLVAPWHVEF